jgi:hypothetical protein
MQRRVFKSCFVFNPKSYLKDQWISTVDSEWLSKEQTLPMFMSQVCFAVFGLVVFKLMAFWLQNFLYHSATTIGQFENDSNKKTQANTSFIIQLSIHKWVECFISFKIQNSFDLVIEVQGDIMIISAFYLSTCKIVLSEVWYHHTDGPLRSSGLE